MAIMIVISFNAMAVTIPAGKLYFDNSKTLYGNVKFVYGSDANPMTRVISMTDEGDNIFSVTIPETVENMYRYTFAETSLDDGERAETFSSVKDYISNTLGEKRTATSEAEITVGWIYTPTSGDNWAQGAWKNPDEKPYSGTLPMMFINTENNTPITSKEEYLNATYYLDPMGIEGVKAFGSKESPLVLQIKGRGNYTWSGFDKKPYRLKLDKKADLMGMPKSKHFGLLAHADDELGFLRNTIGFEISRRLGMRWTPNQHPVEVMLNGEYIGLYLLTELIRVDPDRVNITEQNDEETDPEAITGGWLVEIDNYQEEGQVRIIENGRTEIWFTPKTPEILSDEQRAYLTNLVTNVNSALYQSNKESRDWENYVDIDELAKFYIVQEVLDNAESFHGSCYWHKERGVGQKIFFGPVWDFGNSYRRSNGKFIYQDPPYGQTWIGEMAKFPHFQEVVKKYWDEFLAYDYDGLTQVIDEFEDYIAGAAPYDAERWPQYGSRNFANARNNFKNTLTNRVNWLKEQWGVPDMNLMRYDINRDGVVNVGDVGAAYNIILGNGEGQCDVNGDGQVNVGDVGAIYNYIVNGGETPGPDPDPDDSKYVTVYVKAEQAPHLYAWTNDNGVQVQHGDWPGDVMNEQKTVNGVSYWVARFDVDNINIIFNDGNSGTGHQTSDINGLTRGAHFFEYDGTDGFSVIDPENPNPDPDPDPQPDTETNIAIFVKAEQAPHLFAWTADEAAAYPQHGDWPGDVMTEQETVNGVTYWVARFDLDQVNIIFNDGEIGAGHQTADINGLTRGNHFFEYDGADGYSVIDPENPNLDPNPETDIAIFVKADNAPHLYAWYTNSRGRVQTVNGDWPGEVMETTEERDGETWYVARFDLDTVNIIFNNGQSGVGVNQTSNIEDLMRGAHFYIYDGAGAYEELTNTTE